MKRPLFYVCIVLMLTPLFSEPYPSVAPGTYGTEVVMQIDSLGGSEIFYSFDRQGRFQPFDFPVKLNALEGEERAYTIYVREDFSNGIVEEYSYTYIIDKKSPPVPVPDISPGLYTGPVSLRFTEEASRIYFSVNGTPFSVWEGDSLDLEPGTQQITEYRLTCFSVDETGNVSDTLDYSYYLQKADYSPFEIPARVVSPVPGIFANYQYIVIEKFKDLDIYFTLDGSTPDENSRKYSGPQLIERDGDITLRIAGYNRQGIREISTEVNYSVSISAGRVVSQGSGLYTASVQVEPQESKLVYTLTDNKPDENSIPFTMPIRLGSVPKSTVVYTLQVSPVINGTVSDIVFRYTYMVDNRVPSRPRFIVNSPLPLKSDSLVTMVGDTSSQLYYTMDGSEPGPDTLRYTESIMLELPEDQGNFYLRGIAVDGNGKESDESSIVIPFDRKAPEGPEASISAIPGGYSIDVEEKFAMKLVYEVGWDKENPPVPQVDSPQWQDTEFLLPKGMNAEPVLAFAYIDEAGNISEPEIITFSVDNRQNPAPVITVDNRICTITGEGKIYYKVLENHHGTVNNIPLDQEYLEPFEIPVQEGELKELTIAAYALTEEGQYSEYASSEVVIDTRIPAVPEILNIQNHVVYTTSPIRLKTAPADKGITLHYTMSSDGLEPELPTPRSPRIENLVIETAEDSEVYYHIKILPHNPVSGISGRIRDYQFAVDRKFPELPAVTGFTEEAVYNSRVGITLENIEEGHTAYISITSDGTEPGQPVIFGIPYSDTLFVYPEQGISKMLRLKIAVRDPAGNTTVDPHEYRFILDNEPPQIPIVDGLPSGNVSTGPLSLSVSSEGASEISYRLYRDREWKTQQPGEMRPYTGPIYVDGEPGRKILYYLELLARDMVGNTISEAVKYSFTVDMSGTNRIPEPRAVLFGSHVLVEWRPDIEIEYSLDSEQFMPYVSPLMLPVRQTRIYYRLAGSGTMEEFLLPAPETLPGRIFSGIENGSRVASKVLIRPVNHPGIVRYEMSVDAPASVTAFSPEFNSLLDFDVPSGLTRRFYINFKYFESKNDLAGIALSPLTFTIDKSPPGVPGIRETISGTGDKAQKLIQLYGDGDIYYRFTGTGEDESFRLYDDVMRLDSGNRTFEVFKLQAYAEDSLGNRSPVKTWELIIDQDIVYVSGDGNDYYDGSRLKPVKSLEQAIQIAQEQNRSTLYIYPGVYAVNRPLNIGGLQLVGGYGDGSGSTVIVPGEYFTSKLGLVETSSGDASISNLMFKTGGKNTRSVIFSGGNLYMSGIGFLDSGGAEYLILQDGGNVVIENVSVEVSGDKGIMRQNGGTSSIRNAVFSIPGRPDSSMPAFTSLGGTMEFHNVQLSPGAARKTQGIYGVDSTISISKSTVESGRGTISSSAIVMIDGVLSLSETELAGDQSARTLSLVDASNTRIEIEKSYIHGGSIRGTALLNLRNCSTEISYTTFEGKGDSDFFFTVKGDGGSFGLTNSVMRGEFARDATVLELKNIQAAVHHNVIDISGKSRFTGGIVLETNSGVIIANNIIVNRGGAGTAVTADNAATVIIHNNALHGWINYGVIGKDAASSVRDLNLLDTDPLGGSIHENITEDPARTFKSDRRHLQESSLLINRGNSKYAAGNDIDGESRPNPNSGIRPLPDIGVDEVYP